MEALELAARIGVQKTLAQYGRFVDTGQAEKLARLFTEQTDYRMTPDMVAVSRAEIVPMAGQLKRIFANAPDLGRIRHHMTPAVIDIVAPGRATAFSYFCAYAAAGGDHWGNYRDVLVEVDGEWLFASRVVTLDGTAPSSPVRMFSAST